MRSSEPIARKTERFFRAVKQGDAEVVDSLLLAERELVEAFDPEEFGATPLNLAAGRGDLEMIDLLLRHGADLDARDIDHESTPAVLASGERRSNNANQIYRDPEWRRKDREGALRIHPDDAERLGLAAGQLAVCESRTGSVEVVIRPDDTVRPGCLSLPHGYGQSAGNGNGETEGPRINILTSGDHCDPFAKTPYHKYVPVRLIPVTTENTRAV